jgi:signal transduction histidine kinase
MAVLWRRLLVLLIGGVVALPYIGVIIWVVTAWNELVDRVAALGVLAVGIVTFALLCVPAFLTVIRALERTLAEQLLGLTIAVPARRPTSADRVRGALFYFGHVFAGALLLITVIVLLPTAELLAVEPARVVELSGGFIGTETDLGVDATAENGVPVVRDAPAIVLPADLIQIIAPLTLLLLVAVIIAEGYFLPHYAQILLGPSADDRAALAGTARVQRFRRGLLAREVHDSIGHALTVTTMQATVAKRVLRSDPELAEAAIEEIARSGREAVAELDRVLGLMRAEAEKGKHSVFGEKARQSEPAEALTQPIETPRTMRDIERLTEQARAVGHPTQLSISAEAAALPDELVNELHSIVREALTNSLRHASTPGLTIVIAVEGKAVRVETRNACAQSAPIFARRSDESDRRDSPEELPRRKSRGLVGIGERVVLYGGEVSWGVEEREWILRTVLPVSEDSER